jgi:hypothetical protein
MEDGTRGEYLPSPAPSAPHHLTHPSGLVSSSLFSRFHSCPLAAKPRPRLVDHALIDQYISNQLTADHSLFPILYHHNHRLDQKPVARSFPGLNLRISDDRPSESSTSTPYSIICLCCRRLLSTALRYTSAAARHQGNPPVEF